MLRDAYVFIIPLSLITILFILLGALVGSGYYLVATALLILTGFIAFFFRDPDRTIPDDADTVVSPADGKVVVVRAVDGDDAESGILISIFLSVFDVHVNRTPVAGKITEIEYQAGTFRIATDHRASVENEQNIVTVENDRVKVTFKQIAGVIARRIVFWKQKGDTLRLGERVGLIKFGSRTDIILPHNVKVIVQLGERVKGGSSIIGRING